MDDFGNTVTSLVEHVVGSGKTLDHRGVVTDFLFELVVENHDQAVDLFLKIFNAGLSLTHTARAFKFKGLGDNSHRQNAEFLGNLGDHGSRTGTRSAAHTGRDEQQMRAFERFADLFGSVESGRRTHFRLGTGTQTGFAERDHNIGTGAIERLLVGVGSDKGDALSFFINHVLDGISAAAAHTDHLDAGVENSG